MSECNDCNKGYTEGVPFPEDSNTGSSNAYVVSPSSALKISSGSGKLTAKSFNGYEPVVIEQEAIDVSDTARPASVTCKPRFKAPTWMKGAVCAMRLKLSGWDCDGNSATLCGDGYIRVEDGEAFLEETLTLNADCLYHEDVNGMIGDPICADHLAITDENGKVQSQKPKQGQMSVMVGNGFTSKWCQVDYNELPMCHKGKLDQVNEIELIGFASPTTSTVGGNEIPVGIDPEGTRCVKTLAGEGIPYIEKIYDPAYADGCNDGYRYVTTIKTIDEFKDLLGI